jgi:hypothetical protein
MNVESIRGELPIIFSDLVIPCFNIKKHENKVSCQMYLYLLETEKIQINK